MRYLVTGGTGSFGRAFVNHILNNTTDSVTVFSRDELKQWDMSRELTGYDNRLLFVIGDVRDKSAVSRAVDDVGRVVHAAALKHVHTGEVQPWEVVQTNLIGTHNVAELCEAYRTPLVFLSTDKAVAPVNQYGASKMLAEGIVRTHGGVVVRYGNVLGSRGSILHIFAKEAEAGGVFTITDKRMTRFVITLQQAVDTALKGFDEDDGATLIPDIPAMRIVDLAHAFDSDAEFREIGMQPGEKLAEVLQLEPYIGSDTARKLTIEEIRGLINECL